MTAMHTYVSVQNSKELHNYI